jgi:plasmid maintenance system antidote protein VapI
VAEQRNRGKLMKPSKPGYYWATRVSDGQRLVVKVFWDHEFVWVAELGEEELSRIPDYKDWVGPLSEMPQFGLASGEPELKPVPAFWLLHSKDGPVHRCIRCKEEFGDLEAAVKHGASCIEPDIVTGGTEGPVPPSEILLEEFLKPLGIVPPSLGDLPFETKAAIVHVLQGHPIHNVVAEYLSAHFKNSKQFWLNLQAHYDAEVAKS